jgi:hypothetical protein
MYPLSIDYSGYLFDSVSFYGTQAFRKIVQTPVSPYKINKFPGFGVGREETGIVC